MVGIAARVRGRITGLARVSTIVAALSLVSVTSCGKPAGTVAGEGQQAPVVSLHPGSDPFVARGLYVWPDSLAARAAAAISDPETKTLVTRLAGVPSAIWLTPEAYGLGRVGPFVRGIVEDARATGTIPVFVVYGIPGRDCSGGESSGGLSESDYLPWVSEFAEAVGSTSVAILEPDALADLEECGSAEQRTHLIAEAVGILAGGPVTYVDAGHSRWLSAEEMALRLGSVGVERVRGFAVNVAGYGSEAEEVLYAGEVSDRLGSAAFVIDTGRNGAGPGEHWCNPSGRALGLEPGPVIEDPAWDARLWIKPPGESDGMCAGGPPAGGFWTDRALELAGNAGW